MKGKMSHFQKGLGSPRSGLIIFRSLTPASCIFDIDDTLGKFHKDGIPDRPGSIIPNFNPHIFVRMIGGTVFADTNRGHIADLHIRPFQRSILCDAPVITFPCSVNFQGPVGILVMDRQNKLQLSVVSLIKIKGIVSWVNNCNPGGIEGPTFDFKSIISTGKNLSFLNLGSIPNSQQVNSGNITVLSLYSTMTNGQVVEDSGCVRGIGTPKLTKTFGNHLPGFLINNWDGIIVIYHRV